MYEYVHVSGHVYEYAFVCVSVCVCATQGIKGTICVAWRRSPSIKHRSER